MRVLRAAWSRRGTLATLVAMTAVVVAGSLASVLLADAAGTDRWLALPLLLLGLVAVPETARVLAQRRREEIGLYRLRGVRGLRLLAALLTEPLLAIVVGAALGVVAGVLTAAVTARWLLDLDPPGLTSQAALAVAGVSLAVLLVVAVGTAAALREPLVSQVSGVRRPRRATTLGLFGSVLVIVAAAVAAYRSGTADDPDAVVLLGPALFGLAAGQVTVWLLTRAAAGRLGGGGLPAFLAVRRLARSWDVAAPLRLLVAAGVVGVVSLTGALAVNDWVEDSARVGLGGERFVALEGGALSALSSSRELDPEGEYLMAAMVVDNDDDVLDRRAFVDAARYESVVGDFLDGTGAQPVRELAPPLASGAEPRVVTGDRLTLRAELLEGTAAGLLRVIVTYVNDQNFTAEAELRGRLRNGPLTFTTEVLDCAGGCTLRSIEVARLFSFIAWNGQDIEEPSPGPDLSLLLSSLVLEGGEGGQSDQGDQSDPSGGGIDLLETVFVPAPDMPEDIFGYRRDAQRDRDRLLVNRPDGLQIDEVSLLVVPEDASWPLPVVLAGASDPGRTVRTPGSEERRAGEVHTADALPFLGTRGLLLDLPAALVGDAPAVPTARIGVVVAEDTPAALVTELSALPGAEVVRLAAAREQIAAESGARQASVYLVMAGACALIALIALVSSVARQRGEHRRDVAALRVVGVPRSVARAAGRREVWLQALLAAAGVAGGGALAVWLLLEQLPLLTRSSSALPIDLSVAWVPLAVAAALAAVAVLVVSSRGRDVPELATRPARLREETGVGVTQ